MSRKKLAVILLYFIGATASLALITVFIIFSTKDRKALFGGSVEFEHDGVVRAYRQIEPKNDVSSIVIGFHAFGDSSRRFAYYTGIHNVVDDSTLVIYPDAVRPTSIMQKTGWNAGFCCGSGWKSEANDVGFIVALIADLRNKHGQQADILLTGFSNGAFMAQLVAAEHPELIKGVAVSSGTIGITKKRTEPKSPVPILLMHGEKDKRVSFAGGSGTMDPEFEWLSFADTVQAWQQVNGEEAETKVITYPDNAHKWDGWRLLNVWKRQPNASREVVRFFESI